MQLKNEIVFKIMNRFGLFLPEGEPYSRAMENPTANKYLLSKKISFEVGDKKYTNNIWSGKADVEGSLVRFIIADLSEDIKEYCLLIKLDAFSPYAIRMSEDIDDSRSLFFKVGGIGQIQSSEEEASYQIDEKWISGSTLIQAKLLYAVESLMTELFVLWEINGEYESIYKDLIDFLKFESDNE